MANSHVYKISFLNQGKVYEVYAKGVNQGGLLGFVEVAGLIFGEKSAVVIDPSEERLKAEFDGVVRTYIPMHAVIRIDEVEKQGTAKIVQLDEKGGTVINYPGAFYQPKPEGGDK